MKMCLRSLMLITSVLALMAISIVANANIVINATRVIYPENEKEVTVKLNNVGKFPVLIQSWVDNGDINAKPDGINVPFVLIPPINRVDPNKSQTLRLSYTEANLPADRESIYWLNVLEIPQDKKAIPNRLQVAFRSRIKIFFRPQGLQGKGNATNAAEALVWSVQGNNVVAKNNSPYYVSLVAVALGKDNKGPSVDGEIVPPFGTHSFTFKNKNLLEKGMPINYTYINDWGAMKKQPSTL